MSMREYSISDIDMFAAEYQVRVNDEPWCGKIAVGDTIEVNGINYAVLGINEDAIVIKELK